jgi:hypothetical protein
MARSAAFSISDEDYKLLQAVAKEKGQTVSAFIKSCVWPHVEDLATQLGRAEEIKAQMRAEYKAGGLTKDDLCMLYNKSRDEVNDILAAG